MERYASLSQQIKRPNTLESLFDSHFIEQKKKKEKEMLITHHK